MSPLASEFFALFVYGTVIVLLHELGHALFAPLGGYKVTSVGLGLGQPLVRFKIRGGVVLYIGRWWFGGACHAVPTGPHNSARLWFHGGGLIVQFGLMCLLAFWPEHHWINRAAHFNWLVLCTNATPWRLGSYASDGWYLLDALSGRKRQVDLLNMRPILHSLYTHQLRVGSPTGTFYARLCLAWADVLARQPHEASAFFEQDPPESVINPWFDTLYHYVKSEWHRQLQRPLASLQISRRTDLARQGELHPFSSGLLALSEARALVDLGAQTQARQTLAKLTGMGNAIGNQAMVIHLWTRIADEDLEMVPWVTAQICDRLDHPFLDSVDTAHALLMAAQLMAESHPSGAHDTRAVTVRYIRRIIPNLAFHAQLELRTMMRNLLPSAQPQPTSPHTLLP